MGKIMAMRPVVIAVTDAELSEMRKRNRSLSDDAVAACAAARASAREAHIRCGPGLDALNAMMDGIPLRMQKKWAQTVLKAA